VGKTRICVAGYGISHNTGRAQKLASVIAQQYPEKYETWFYFSTFEYKQFLEGIKPAIPKEQLSQPSTLDANPKTIQDHTSSPFVWMETTSGGDGNKQIKAVGGRDKFCEWASTEFPKDADDIQSLTSLEEPVLLELFFDYSTPGGTWMEHENKDNKE